MDEVALSGKYRAYPEYKDSGVEWLGAIPTSWNLSPLKHLCRFKGGGTPNKDNVEYWNGSIPWVSPKDMKSEIIISSIDRITLRAVNESSTAIIESRCLLVVVRSGILQHSIPVAINAVPVTLNQDMKALRFHNNFSVDYAKYFVIGHQRSLTLAWGKQGATVESVEHEYLSNCLFPVPSLSEQTQIANFLDHETAKIDALIEKQQRLIALLKEKRQAVISHAVTKGLSRKGESNAPMKDSGVEWLGEVPSHWSVGALGYYAQLNTGATPDRGNSIYWSGDIPWVKTGEIRYREITDTEEHISEAALKATSVQLSPAGTLVMAMYGQGVTRGRVALLGTEATYNQACVAINTTKSIGNHYLQYFFMAAYHAIRDGGNETSQMNLNADIVSKFKIVVPPRDKQTEIVAYLDLELPRFDRLLAKAEEAIKIMQERRTALISAAVTGKIDVRNYQPGGEAA